jgi:hypothetical protein
MCSGFNLSVDFNLSGVGEFRILNGSQFIGLNTTGIEPRFALDGSHCLGAFLAINTQRSLSPQPAARQ